MDVRKSQKLVSKHKIEHHLTYLKRIKSFQTFDFEKKKDGVKVDKLKSYSIYATYLLCMCCMIKWKVPEVHEQNTVAFIPEVPSFHMTWYELSIKQIATRTFFSTLYTSIRKPINYMRKQRRRSETTQLTSALFSTQIVQFIFFLNPKR